MNINTMDDQSKEAQEAQKKMLEVIRNGAVKPRPRWYFVLENSLMITGGVILALLVIYLASFIVFALKQTGVSSAPSFGLAGWYVFFRSLPWLLIILLIIFMLILAVMVNKYAVAYEHPAIYLFVGLVVIVGIGGLLIGETPFNNDLMTDSRAGGLPMLGYLYRGYELQSPDDIHRGMIIATTTGGFIIEDDNGQTSTVFFIGPMASVTDGPTVGNEVVIFGERSPSGTISGQGMASDGE
jgi:hypothetical protein